MDPADHLIRAGESSSLISML